MRLIPNASICSRPAEQSSEDGGRANRGHEGYLWGAPTSPRIACHAVDSNADRQRCVTFGHFDPRGAANSHSLPRPLLYIPVSLFLSHAPSFLKHPPLHSFLPPPPICLCCLVISPRIRTTAPTHSTVSSLCSSIHPASR